MQHSGISAPTCHARYASSYVETVSEKTFRIRTYSTALKKHVMVMDLVKSNWFPSQRKAKVCVIHMCQGMKTTKKMSSNYEIHSQLFSSPKEHSAWERNAQLTYTGLQASPYNERTQLSLRNLQPEVAEKTSDFAKETVASRKTKMISSLLISQLIDERRLRKNAPALPGQCMMVQPEVHPMNLSLASHSPADIDQAFLLLPGRMGIKTSGKEAGAGSSLPLKEEKTDPNPRKGFSSITITARRVVPPASTLMWGTTIDPLCSKCGAKEKTDSPDDQEPGPHHRLLNGHGSLTNRLATSFKASESHGQLCEGHPCWILNPENKENEMIPPAIPSHGEKVPLLFSSCVHLRVSQPCSNTVHYLDKSLSIPLDQPPIPGSKVHKSVLSLNLSCSSHGLTADGADRMTNTEEEATEGNPLSQKHAEQKEKRSPMSWGDTDFKESCLKENPAWNGISLGNYPCPWSSTPPLGNAEYSDPGEVGKMKGDSMAMYHTRSHPNKLAIHIPGWSYAAETKAFSGNIKMQQGEQCMALSATLVGPSPINDFVPDVSGSPKDDYQSSKSLESQEIQPQQFLKSKVPLPDYLCPLKALCPSSQEDIGVPIKSPFPPGDYRCCDLVVKLKKYQHPIKEEEMIPDAPPAPSEPMSPQKPDVAQEQDVCPEPELSVFPVHSLTLREALEVYKPQFISRSQERLRKLESMAQQRKAQGCETPRKKPSPLPLRPTKKKQYTIPHPLSDNLFKPKERCISEKEMHMRSKRIYNNLPEVKKKKEEQKKRVILQSNRLRVEVFKKQLLDQILQRSKERSAIPYGRNSGDLE
ncbi:(E2-independent) E3 ubiquitin-conjugating enzyme FATS [Gracilinanus agilis]|uniref:(E2-independent) E3 ubiquitin-conjugating enzyme FATS n=1 Tax=Gracilinanus agilis TaxID=191870 RepID=UPI001CFC7C34|nr:(E2-independent) E3 ubiquitin-conjugating enzyme FATS [Gracilinanus agilis]